MIEWKHTLIQVLRRAVDTFLTVSIHRWVSADTPQYPPGVRLPRYPPGPHSSSPPGVHRGAMRLN
jgi:hypothetical protein